ncbi:hypothetical protein WJX72_006392 [[Myrmecia] bisecta]|uniref:Uncharacterized protein n=1 Tax=[Myrmecia] bisecta TaxID=41462 RepID=A0AAW1QR16_9CHLO
MSCWFRSWQPACILAVLLLVAWESTVWPETQTRFQRKASKDYVIDELWLQLGALPAKLGGYCLSDLWRVDSFGNVVYRRAKEHSICSWVVDHLFPIARGGPDNPKNACNKQIISALANGVKLDRLQFMIPPAQLRCGQTVEFLGTLLKRKGLDWVLEHFCVKVTEPAASGSHAALAQDVAILDTVDSYPRVPQARTSKQRRPVMPDFLAPKGSAGHARHTRQRCPRTSYTNELRICVYKALIGGVYLCSRGAGKSDQGSIDWDSFGAAVHDRSLPGLEELARDTLKQTKGCLQTIYSYHQKKKCD